MIKKTKTKYEIIKWKDHFSQSSWRAKEDMKRWATDNVVCTTIGENTYEDKDVVVLAASNDGTGDYSETMCIIKMNIVNRKKILI